MSSSKHSLNTPLKKARGLGSSHDGGHHWIMERLTSVALIPLVIWFVASIISLVGADYSGVTAFFQSPVHAALMAILIIFSFYHAVLGLTVVIEDYVHNKAKKIICLLVVKFSLFLLGTVTVLAIAKMHLAV